MDESGTDLADTPVESIDIGSGTSSFDEQPTDGSAPTDLADAPTNHAPAEVETTPVVEDLAAGADDQLANSSNDTKAEAPFDLAEAIDSADAIEADAPQDWREGEVVDLCPDGDNAEPDSAVETAADLPDKGEDLGLPEHPHGSVADDGANPGEATVKAEDLSAISAGSDSDTNLSIEGLTEAAQVEVKTSDERCAEYEAIVVEALSDDTSVQEVRVESAQNGLTDAIEPATSSDQTDTMDLRNSPDNKALTAALAERGFELEAVDRFDFSDNPVLEYRESAPAEDISYAVKAWNDQISPGIASGAAREHFEAYDQAQGLEGHQRLAGVYDYFLGSDAIRSGGERENGTLDVNNGRHRLEQARLNSVTYLPVRK